MSKSKIVKYNNLDDFEENRNSLTPKNEVPYYTIKKRIFDIEHSYQFRSKQEFVLSEMEELSIVYQELKKSYVENINIASLDIILRFYPDNIPEEKKEYSNEGELIKIPHEISKLLESVNIELFSINDKGNSFDGIRELEFITNKDVPNSITKQISTLISQKNNIPSVRCIFKIQFTEDYKRSTSKKLNIINKKGTVIEKEYETLESFMDENNISLKELTKVLDYSNQEMEKHFSSFKKDNYSNSKGFYSRFKSAYGNNITLKYVQGFLDAEWNNRVYLFENEAKKYMQENRIDVDSDLGKHIKEITQEFIQLGWTGLYQELSLFVDKLKSLDLEEIQKEIQRNKLESKLEITLEFDENLSDEEITKLTKEYILTADKIFRESGGAGLEIDDIDVSKEKVLNPTEA